MLCKKGDVKKPRIQMAIFITIMLLILFSTLFFLFSYRQLNKNIQQERRDFVSEISQQLSTNISTVRSTNLQISSLLATTLSNIQPATFKACRELVYSYIHNDVGIFFATEEGSILSVSGTPIGIDNRDYISDALRQNNYSAFERVGSENEYWLFSSILKRPYIVEGQKIQTIILAWEKEKYSESMTISIFDGLGYSFLIKSSGVITVSPKSADVNNIGFNILTTLQEWGIEPSVYNNLHSDLQTGKNNSLVCKLGGIQWLIQYHQLEEGSYTFIMLPLALTAAETYQGLTSTMLAVLGVLLSLALLIIYVILITTKKEKLRQKEIYEVTLAKKAVEAKNDFLAKMSHDIRTPLNGIIWMNYIASIQIGPDNKEAQSSLKKMEIASRYLLSIINDILDMSKIESGKMQLASKAFSLDELLQNIRNMLEITAVEKD